MGLNTELQEMHRILQVSLSSGDVYDRLVKTDPIQSNNVFIPISAAVGLDPLQ